MKRLDVDMSGVRVRGDQHHREHEIVLYASRLWGAGARGFVCLGIGSGPYVDDDGKYRHRSFGHRYFTWPYELEQLVAYAGRHAHHSDVFVTPALRTRKDRRRGSAGLSSWLWVDVDGTWDDERERRWQRLRDAGAFMVDSGRGRHLYVPAGEWMEPDAVEARNRKLAGLFTTASGVGEKWESNALLRLPGTFNFKGWAKDGRDPAPVSLVRTP